MAEDPTIMPPVTDLTPSEGDSDPSEEAGAVFLM